jgi:hypothetical protein
VVPFYGCNGCIFIRSEQDKEPVQEAMSEVVGPVPTTESSTDGMW